MLPEGKSSPNWNDTQSGSAVHSAAHTAAEAAVWPAALIKAPLMEPSSPGLYPVSTAAS